ncbi:Zinc finger with UFM1-specific peptidase domain protein [Fasciola hepatica]|uniref:Zinc finger with UFM1-specific peptidase domain protein n=1 Tax=Fasciola hepatica TaxID=6192 RepID=A0A4E0RHU8_FASHE|nr:Zinc finger with UFM1-specific peptidase domain protein [Fasciola hepatica]
MSFWSVIRRDENQEVDYGSMHLNEPPSLYLMPSETGRCSAQVLANQWLDRCVASNQLSLVDYRIRLQELRRAVRLGIDSAGTCTDGIISALRQLVDNGWMNNRWHLVSTDCDHFAAEPWEEGFACCYRNAQCVLSSLFRMSDFRKRLFGGLSAMPSVWKLQALLEAAWTLGFDPLGASQLAASIGSDGFRSSLADDSDFAPDGRNLVGLVDSTAWLGVSDLVSLFGSIGIRCTLLECRAPSGPNNTHPRLLEHIYSYILSGRVSSTSLETFSVPMILQHEGHSRVVIGVELDSFNEPAALIVLDPNTPVEAMNQLIKAAECSQSPDPNSALSRLSYAQYSWTEVLGSLRVDASRLTHSQYQLLQINGLIETEQDLQDSMTPENITIAIS